MKYKISIGNVLHIGVNTQQLMIYGGVVSRKESKLLAVAIRNMLQLMKMKMWSQIMKAILNRKEKIKW